MTRKLLPTAALLLLAAACQPYEPYEPYGQARSDPNPGTVFRPGARPFDAGQGFAAAQTAEPPPGLVLVRQGDLIGRGINDGNGQGLVYVQYVLADPATGEARYAVASSDRFGGYVLVPVSTIYDSGDGIAVRTNARQVELMPKYSLAQIEQRWPPRTLASAAPYAYGLPPAAQVVTGYAPGHSAMPAVEPLQLMRRGSVVGMNVVDSFGQPVGRVDAVAAVPGTGEVRYAIVGGPSFAPGTYIAVPASSARLADGRVVLNGSSANWSAAPHYRAEQIQQFYGPLGMVN